MNANAISLLFLVIFKINCINLLIFDVHSCHATRMNQETRQGSPLGALSLLFLWASKEITKEKTIFNPVGAISLLFPIERIRFVFFTFMFILCRSTKNEPRKRAKGVPLDPLRRRHFKCVDGRLYDQIGRASCRERVLRAV